MKIFIIVEISTYNIPIMVQGGADLTISLLRIGLKNMIYGICPYMTGW